MSDDPRALVQRYYDALNRRDPDTLDHLLAPDLVHRAGGLVMGRDAQKQMLLVYQAGFPDLAHTVEEMVIEGDRIAVRTTTTGTHAGPFLGHPASNRHFSASAFSLYQVGGGLIRQIWDVFDTLAMLQQLGLYTPATSSPGVRPPASPGAATLPAPPPFAERRQPPGPDGEISLAEVRADPLRFLTGLTREYGDYVRYVCDGRPTILLNRPEAVQHVLHDRASNYTKADTPDLLLLKPMLGDGLLTTEGAAWKQDRHWLQPTFAFRRMERAGSVMVEVALEMVARWRARSDLAAPLDIVREMSRLTLEIAARVMFSTDFAAHSEAFGQAMDVLNECMGHARPHDPDVQGQFRPALALIRRTVWQVVLSRKFHDSGEDDVLASLLRAQRERGDSEQHVVDQAVTLVLAGHETTAKALSWTIALLDANPEARQRLHLELAEHLGGRAPTVEDLPRLRYTRAVIEEALRLDPPIWLMTRTASEDDTIAGYAIPAGALVAISPYLIHRHPELWPEPERFLPERFLAEASSVEAGMARAYRYLPFSHGPRLCIGKFFAMLEMPLVLATVCSAFEMRSLAGPNLDAEALVTLRPRHGLPMSVRTRSSAAFAAEGRPAEDCRTQ